MGAIWKSPCEDEAAKSRGMWREGEFFREEKEAAYM